MALDLIDIENMIDDLQASEQEQSNCMLQLSLIVARLALSPMSEDYRDHASQTMLELIRAKRKSSPVVSHPRFSFNHGKLVSAQGPGLDSARLVGGRPD